MQNSTKSPNSARGFGTGAGFAEDLEASIADSACAGFVSASWLIRG
ncbi:hypothetical protein THTE_1400 [Thermogutta terrifontis]|uniref:Uncharacterized protein n=1 Tax=Thermogutta terrifontis TaxID=1331910 RepID=A0A286RDI9_9BACT|nr:hypothetical protein THTE_1400 [Thermogutta terrifontis]